VCEVLSELVGTKVERRGITRLGTKQSTSSSSLRHVTDCSVEGKECGEGKWLRYLSAKWACGYNYIMEEGDTLSVHSTYVPTYKHLQLPNTKLFWRPFTSSFMAHLKLGQRRA